MEIEKNTKLSQKDKYYLFYEMMIQSLKTDDVKIGLNQGVVTHQAGDSIKKTYIEADTLMAEDKNNMYVRLGLNRRR